MFEHLSTYHYGRCVKSKDWYINSVCVNRIYYIHRGEVTVLLDGKPYLLKPGKIYLIPQNLRFELQLTENTQVDHTFFDFFTLPAISMPSPLTIEPGSIPFIDEAARVLCEIAEKHQTYPSMERNEYSDIVEVYLSNLLSLIHLHKKITTINDQRINIALDYIHKNYGSQITLEHLTRVTNLEKNYFIRLFKRYMNATPHQYIMKYRFNIALTQIKRNCPLSEVALHIGYSDVASFSHEFKRIYGIAPSAVKR